MALSMEHNNTPGASAAPSPTPSNAASAANMGVQALPLSTLLTTYASAGALSQEASAYAEQVIAELRKKDPKITHKWVNIKGLDAIAFISTDAVYAIGIIFAEYMTADVEGHVPITWCEELQTQLGNGTRMLDALVIVKEDYRKALQMANNVYRVLHGQTSGVLNAFNIQSIRRQNQIFRVTSVLNEGLQHIDQLNPQASRPRTDMTITLEVASTDKRLPNNEYRWDRLITVGAYTRFADFARWQSFAQPNYQQYPAAPQAKRIVPIVNITSVVSEIPSANILAFALPMAANAWLSNCGYLKAYQRISKDGINIGNLVIDGNDQPVFLESKQMFDLFVQEQLTPPVLAMDVTFGRSRVIGSALLKQDRNTLNQSFNTFFAGTAPELLQLSNNMVQCQFEEYIGLLSDGNDSRCLDYLALLANKLDYRKCVHLLNITNEPTGTVHGKDISQFDSKYRPLYWNTTVIFNTRYLDELGRQFSKENTAVQIDWGTGSNEGSYVNLGSLEFQPYHASFGVPASRRSGYNPMYGFSPLG